MSACQHRQTRVTIWLEVLEVWEAGELVKRDPEHVTEFMVECLTCDANRRVPESRLEKAPPWVRFAVAKAGHGGPATLELP